MITTINFFVEFAKALWWLWENHAAFTSNRTLYLTHWGRVTHICVSKLPIIGSDNGLSPGRCQAIIWTNTWIVLMRTLGTNFSEILIEIHTFAFQKMHLKMASAKWRLSRRGLNVLNVRRFCETHPINMRIFFCLCRKHSHVRGNILFARIIWIWVISLWGRLNTNISPHRYRDPHYRVTIIMGIFIPGKTVFILKQGPVLGHDRA